MQDYMPEDQKKLWQSYPLKIMIGECHKDKGFMGLDVAFVGLNEAVSIKMKDLARAFVSLMDLGLCQDKDECGILIVLGGSSKITNIDLNGIIDQSCTKEDWANRRKEILNG